MRIFGLPPATDRRVGLLARIGLLGLAVASSSLALGPVNVLERSYNKYRTGAGTAETALTPANVKSTANLFHKQFVMKVMARSKALLFMPPRSPSPAASTTSFMPPPCTTPSLPSMPIPARSFP